MASLQKGKLVRPIIRLHPRDKACLFPGEELNGESINSYLRLVERRTGQTPSAPKVMCLDTYFYAALCRSGQETARRHHKQYDLSDFDLVLIPIHERLGERGHWWLAAMKMGRKQIVAFDSIPGRNHKEAMECLWKYATATVRDPPGSPRWNLREGKCQPQPNKVDCGVYLCRNAQLLAEGKEPLDVPFNPTEERRRMEKAFRDYRLPVGSGSPAEFPGADPDWSFEELAEELAILTDPQNWSPSSYVTGPEEEGKDEWEEIEFPEEELSTDMTGDAPEMLSEIVDLPVARRPSLLEMTAVSPIHEESDILSLSPGWSITSSIEVLPLPEEEDMEIVPAAVQQPPTQPIEESRSRGLPTYTLSVEGTTSLQLSLPGPSSSNDPPAPGPDKQKRTRGKRRVMRVLIPGTNIKKRINVRRLGLPVFKNPK